MISKEKSAIKAFLFVFDGVVMDTAPQCGEFLACVGAVNRPEIDSF